MLFSLAPLTIRGAARELHVSRAARERYGVEEEILSIRGTLLFADVEAAMRLAYRMNEERDSGRYPELAVSPAELFAAGLIHEFQHLLIAIQRERLVPDPIATGLRAAGEELGRERLEELLLDFIQEFPTASVERGSVSAEDYLTGRTEGTANREVVWEELLLLRLANSNPALERFADLFDDSELQERVAYARVVQLLDETPAATGGPSTEAGKSLLDLLRAPALASPTSLQGQLRFIRREWLPLLGDRTGEVLNRLLLGSDLLTEEAKPKAVGPPELIPVPESEDLAGPGGVRAPARFSPDAGWMPEVVLLAKSTYVWLDQLARRYDREVDTLDQIPDAALDEIAERGFSGLWLIGLWERSDASRRIKHRRGQPDAVASAYALFDYRIADDLGGEGAYHNLRDRALQRGVRLASDMVPNHVGIDGRWLIEHPERFVQLDRSPYPGYSFEGPDLSSNERVSVFLEDHYWDSSDAAVVFKRVERATGEVRFIYHGNDGTAMPWNDTAQLDYLQAEVREAVIETILEVARRFPIIRFDAAMTLAKEHVRRLWYPEPGQGGAIPSRAQYGSMSQEEFDRAMPVEFWREVVDRVAREVPDTLLLAEAFWMMEGYFVRTLGMHRVYNSAFMNMLKREANADFRQLLESVLRFDPQVLGRFVNFMNNPDEDTAVAQFGTGDKYFGVCTLMCTMPGLPMFGHGQVEGFEEKYGMEFRRARRVEHPDPWLVERHQREIFPLLHRRAQFARADEFRLYDLRSEDGRVNEDVIVYSNRVDGEASLIVYNNRYAEAGGRVHSGTSGQGEGTSADAHGQSTLFEGLGLRGGADRFVVFRDFGSDLEHLVAAEELRERGMELRLGAFEYRVMLDFREVRDGSDEPYAELARELAGRGVPSVRDAALDLRFRPLFDAFGEILDTPLDETNAALASYRDLLDVLERYGQELGRPRRECEAAFEALLEGVSAHLASTPAIATSLRRIDTTLLSWAVLAPLPRDLFTQYRLDQELSTGSHTRATSPDAVAVAEAVPLLLDHAGAAAGTRSAGEIVTRLLDDSRNATFLRVNSYQGKEYFNQEAFRLLAEAVVLAESLLEIVREGVSEGLADRLAELRRLEERSGYEVERLRSLSEVKRERGREPSGGERSGG